MILFLDFILFLFVMVIIMGFIIQVVIPLKDGTPLFPWFRKTPLSEKMKAASKKLEEVAELEQLESLEAEINRRKAQLKKET